MTIYTEDVSNNLNLVGTHAFVGPVPYKPTFIKYFRFLDLYGVAVVAAISF